MARVFISYTHRSPDDSVAQTLANVLGTKHTIFIDTHIPGGATWGEVIETELGAADFLITLLSIRSADSPMVVAEIARAHQYNVANGRPNIVPVRLDHTLFKYPLFAYVSRFQEIDGGDPVDVARLAKAILDALDRLAKRVATDFWQPPERKRLIQRVRVDWIAGVLRPSTQGGNFIDHSLSLAPDAVERGADAILQRTNEAPAPLRPNSSPVSVFDDHLGQLLILGEPGSGKTTFLLRLLEELLERAEQDFTQPVPILLNLSSWRSAKTGFDAWLVDELQTRMDVPSEQGKKWVKAEQLVLLLDGLDETDNAVRGGCVEAINRYRFEHGFVQIAVASRTAEYEALVKRLRIPAAIKIQSLSRQQVEAHLSSTASPLLEWSTSSLAGTEELFKLLTTPLMLRIASGLAPAAPSRPIGESTVSSSSMSDQLFAAYVASMFGRRAPLVNYGPGETVRALSWLAAALISQRQTLFRIDDLRSTWLDSRSDRLTVASVIAILVGVGSALLADAFMIALVVITFYMKSIATVMLYVTLVCTPFFFAIGVIVSLVRGRVRRPVVALQFGWPGALPVVIALLEGMTLGAILGYGFGETGCLLVDAPGATYGITPIHFTLMAAIVFGTGAMINAFARTPELQVRPAPDAALRQSLRYTTVYLSLSVAIGLIGIAALLVLHHRSSEGMMSTTAAVVGAFAFLGWVGFFFALEKGGYFLLDHFISLRMITRSKTIPPDLLGFLDFCCERAFLRRVGTGYLFFHRLLLDYFSRCCPGYVDPRRESTPDAAWPNAGYESAGESS